MEHPTPYCRRLVLLGVAVLLWMPSAVIGQVPAAGSAVERREEIETTVGMEGVYYLRYDGPSIEALSVDEEAAVILRIADVVQDGKATIYELRYLGMRPGSYDLCQFVRRVDGEPIAGLAPAAVAVHAILPEDHNGELAEIPPPGMSFPWRYRLWLAAAAALWLVPLAWLIVRRVARRSQAPALLSTSPPTLADQLRPLVEAAVAGELSTVDQARLELLLIAHWRERLGLGECSTVESLARMRKNAEAGQLLAHLERWLHEPPGRHAVDVGAILRPYRAHAAVEVPG